MLSAIPTPSNSVIGIGPLTIHYYALCIIIGVAVAIWLGNKRYRTFAKKSEQSIGVVADVAIYAVPAGIIGGRIYHVVTSPAQYFGENGNPLDALKIYEGGLGIWGAISLGALAAWFGYRKRAKNLELPSYRLFLDALAPGILIAQAIGRIGNWFNGELFGRPFSGPWALEIPLSKRPIGYLEFESFHPTFLYEAIWCLLVAVLLIWLTPKLKAGQGFAIYVALYCVGRFVIETLRIDDANEILGLRVNLWTALIVGLIASVFAIRFARRKMPEIG
jgi:prolipoprotein diacylglyceryl transferase